MIANEILVAAGQQLTDLGFIRWTPSSLLSYLNLGIVEIVGLVPNAYSVPLLLTLVPGAEQALPASVIQVQSFLCNMGLTGATQGASVRAVVKKQLDFLVPNWFAYDAGDIVQFVARDPYDNKKFYVFPPQPSPVTQRLAARVHSTPTVLLNVNAAFPLDDSYKPAAVDYLVYRALAEETDIPGALEKSKLFRAQFMQDLGLKARVDKQVASDLSMPTGNPPTQQEG